MKSQEKKVLLCTIGIALAIIVLIGAIFVGKFVTGGSTGKAAEAAEKLSKKYNRNIVVKEVYSKKIGQAYYEVEAYPEGEPDVLFTATIDTNDEFFSDNYVERHICKQITKKIYENCGTEAGIYIFTEALGPQPITDDINQSIQDYARLDPLNKFKANIFVTSGADKYWSSSVLFSGLDLNISAEIFTVNQEQLQTVKKYLLNHGETNTLEYKKIIMNFPSNTI